MERRQFFLGLAATLAVAGGPALAGTRGEAVINRIRAQLDRQGYARISVERTLLGRVRILAVGPAARREIIVDPRTGEILRDLWQVLDPNADLTGGDMLLDGSDTGSGDDDNDDDKDKDNSGHGSDDGDHGNDG